MSLHVCGESYQAVAFAVNTETGYVGRKAELVNEVTPHVLDWWGESTLPVTATKSMQERSCARYVKRNIERPSFWANPVQFAFWPLIINAVVQMILEWLNSRESQDWRMANQ